MQLVGGRRALLAAAVLGCGGGAHGTKSVQDAAADVFNVSPDAPRESLKSDSAVVVSLPDSPSATRNDTRFSICAELGEGYPIRLALSADEVQLVELFSTGRAEVRRMSDGGLVKEISLGSLNERISDAQFVDGGRLLAARVYQTVRMGSVYNSSQRIRLVSVQDGRVVRENPFPSDVAAVSPDGELHVPGKPPLALVRTRDGATLWTKPEPEVPPRSAAFSADGQFVAFAAEPRVRVYRVNGGELVAAFTASGFNSYFEMVAISADGALVGVSYDDDGDGVDVWRLSDRAHFHLAALDEAELRFTGADHLVIDDKTLVRFDPDLALATRLPEDLAEIHVLRGGRQKIGRHVEGNVRSSELAGETRPAWELPPPRGHASSVIGLGYDRATRTLVSTDSFRRLRYWDLRSEAALARSVPGPSATHPTFATAVFSPTLHHLAAVTHGGQVTLWSLPNEVRLPFLATGQPAFSSDGTFLATTGGGAGISVHRISDGGVVLSLPESRGAVALSPDGALLATGGVASVRIHGAKDGTLLREASLPPSRGFFPIVGHALAFSSDSRRLAAATAGNLVVIDAATGAVVWRLDSERSGPGQLALSSDGSFFAAVSPDGLGVWSVDTGQPTLPLDPRSANRERALLFLTDAPMLVTGDSDGVVRLRCH